MDQRGNKMFVKIKDTYLRVEDIESFYKKSRTEDVVGLEIIQRSAPIYELHVITNKYNRNFETEDINEINAWCAGIVTAELNRESINYLGNSGNGGWDPTILDGDGQF